MCISLYIVWRDQFQDKLCPSSIKAHWCFIFILSWLLIRLQAGCCQKILLPWTSIHHSSKKHAASGVLQPGRRCGLLGNSIPHSSTWLLGEDLGNCSLGLLLFPEMTCYSNSHKHSTDVETELSIVWNRNNYKPQLYLNSILKWTEWRQSFRVGHFPFYLPSMDAWGWFRCSFGGKARGLSLSPGTLQEPETSCSYKETGPVSHPRCRRGQSLVLWNSCVTSWVGRQSLPGTAHSPSPGCQGCFLHSVREAQTSKCHLPPTHTPCFS